MKLAFVAACDNPLSLDLLPTSLADDPSSTLADIPNHFGMRDLAPAACTARRDRFRLAN
jgi:hypothetical protein